MSQQTSLWDVLVSSLFRVLDTKQRLVPFTCLHPRLFRQRQARLLITSLYKYND